MGLLLAHKRTLKVYPDLLVSSNPTDHRRVGGGKRSAVKVFSADSRYRLFLLMHKLTFKTVTFCTLTYPADFPTESAVYKGHLKEYRRRFERLYGAVKAVWRLEFQRRGAPHYHIMYLDAPFIPVADWCKLWSSVIHTDDQNHGKIGVDVKLVSDAREGKLIASYLAKYVGKIDESEAYNGDRKPGRWWGKWNVVEEDPIVFDVGSREAECTLAFALAARGGDSSWQPGDATVYSVFGGSMGCGDFGDGIIDVLEKNGFYRREG